MLGSAGATDRGSPFSRGRFLMGGGGEGGSVSHAPALVCVNNPRLTLLCLENLSSWTTANSTGVSSGSRVR